MDSRLAESREEALLDGFTQTIDGIGQESASSFDVIDPSTGRPFARSPDATREQLDAAVAAAVRAQRTWGVIPVKERRESLLAFAGSLRENREPLALLLVREQGKPLFLALDEIERSVAALEAISSMVLASEVLVDDAVDRIEVHYKPLGVVAAITPWNVPLFLAVTKIAQALLVGNTIVVKPSPFTPLTTLELGRLARDVLPAGVLNVIAGRDPLGNWMTDHADIAKVSFTGSVRTGKHVMASASATLKRLTLELGGNDAAIVLPDVDPEAIADSLFWAAFYNCGQTCMAIKRLYVHDAVYEEMCAALARRARELPVGRGTQPGVRMGPVQNRMQFDRVCDVLRDTRTLPGARILAGGAARDGDGYFIEPTIVADVVEGCRLVDEETFGPVLPVIRFFDVEDVVERANASRMGLGASVWTQDEARGMAIALRLEAGTVWVNRHLNADVRVPFGGVKESGVGREFGLAGLKGYTEPCVVSLRKSR